MFKEAATRLGPNMKPAIRDYIQPPYGNQIQTENVLQFCEIADHCLDLKEHLLTDTKRLHDRAMTMHRIGACSDHEWLFLVRCILQYVNNFTPDKNDAVLVGRLCNHVVVSMMHQKDERVGLVR